MSFSGLCRPLLAYEDHSTIKLAAATADSSPVSGVTKSEEDIGGSKDIGYRDTAQNDADLYASAIPYAELLRISQEIRKAVSIKDRWCRFRLYGACFIGSEAVDWLVSSTTCKDRLEAVAVGNRLLTIGLFHHGRCNIKLGTVSIAWIMCLTSAVLDQHEFEDGYLYYRYFVDEHRGYRQMFSFPW
jgi:hypothetical protein